MAAANSTCPLSATSSSSSSSSTTNHGGKVKTRKLLRDQLFETTTASSIFNHVLIDSPSREMHLKSSRGHFMDASSSSHGRSINRMLHINFDLNNSPNFVVGESSRPISPLPNVVTAAANEDDGRIHSLPYRKYGPYTCPRCNELFNSSQSFASHVSTHYKYETDAERTKRLTSRSRIRKRNLRLGMVNDAITFVPSSSAYASQAQPIIRSTTSLVAPPDTSVVKVEHGDDDHKQIFLPPRVFGTSLVVGDPVPPPPSGFEAHHVLRNKIKTEEA